jgi:diadenylate cyclase
VPGPFRIGDVVDILLVTTLVYATVVWLRRTQAWFVAVGLLLLAALYAIARAADLRLTTWLLNSFFAILVVVIVVIFQDELRQLFERLAVWSPRRRPPQAAVGTVPSDVLVQTLGDLARQRIGALVVLPGRQPIERYVRGGVPLDGVLSVPLLKSLFDPHSPGHDGAVLVEGDRVRRFAGHLPLSTDFTQLHGVGTRHAAALGLAELTDALCLVVSEERGEIAVARDGRLRRPVDVATLAATLADFHRAAQPPDNRRWPFWRALVFAHGAEKAASLLVVTGLWWALVPGARVVERTFDVPVHVVNLPPTLALDGVEPQAVRVTLAAEQREFYLFNPRLLDVSVDASLASAGRRTFALGEEAMRLPKELRLRDIQPSSVRIAVRPAPPATGATPPEVD